MIRNNVPAEYTQYNGRTLLAEKRNGLTVQLPFVLSITS